jgi:Mn-dependent transcriptional regulator
MTIRESAENYLETILILSRQKGPVRSIDIASELGYAKPSISIAMKKLREDGYLTVDAQSGYITLTDKGMEIALTMFERHRILSAFLMHVGVSEEIAVADACKIEHVISAESFEMIKQAMDKHEKL